MSDLPKRRRLVEASVVVAAIFAWFVVSLIFPWVGLAVAATVLIIALFALLWLDLYERMEEP